MSRATFIDGLLGRPRDKTAASLSQITRDVAAAYGVSVMDMCSKVRTYKVAHARQEAMRRAKNLGFGVRAIGVFFSRDHTTVMHGIKAATRRMAAE
tara:strand:- start:212 stop:499 length:288 start_codon:yes stop_codon:yes gene_type:complete